MACLMVAMGVALPARAQFRLGVKGGLDVSKIRFSKSTEWIGDNAAGFFIGPMVEYTSPTGIGLDAAALYSQAGLKVKSGDTKNLSSIEIPLRVKWSKGLGDLAGIYLAVGPQFGFSLEDEVSGLTVGDLDTRTCAVSVNVGVGVNLIKHWQVGVNYNVGASKLANRRADNFEESVRKSSWQLSAAYLF